MIPSGNRLHNELEKHYAINKWENSRHFDWVVFNSYVD